MPLCPRPEKKIYYRRKTAQQACDATNRITHDNAVPLVPYKCVCGFWHMGHELKTICPCGRGYSCYQWAQEALCTRIANGAPVTLEHYRCIHGVWHIRDSAIPKEAD